ASESVLLRLLPRRNRVHAGFDKPHYRNHRVSKQGVEVYRPARLTGLPYFESSSPDRPSKIRDWLIPTIYRFDQNFDFTALFWKIDLTFKISGHIQANRRQVMIMRIGWPHSWDAGRTKVSCACVGFSQSCAQLHGLVRRYCH